MHFDVTLKINETTMGIGTETNINLEVNLAPSGLYIAVNPPEPFMASGETPRHAVLAFLGYLFYRMTVEAEQANS